MELTRRNIMIGALAGGGLALGYALMPRQYPLPLSAGEGEHAFDAWIKLARDGTVTVAVPQLEMGQGVTTLIPQIVAMELGADWRKVAAEPAPPSALYANYPLAARWAELWMPVLPALGDSPVSPVTRRMAESGEFTATADGTTLAAYEATVRRAAAAVRALLCRAAAEKWGTDWADCEAVQGFIVQGKRRASFGSLAAAAAKLDPPSEPVLRADPPHDRPSQFPPGTALAFPRLDLPAKAIGAYLFAGDVRLPGMVYAAIRHGPLGDARLEEFQENAARSIAGFVGAVKNERWLAAVAENSWAAERALDAMAPVHRASRRADSNRMDAALDKGLRNGKAVRLQAAGDPDVVLDRKFTLARRYDVGPALHATLETATATARFQDGKLELWIASQAPAQARKAAADALGINPRKVVVYPMAAGGSFDRRLEHDHAAEAALIAREIKRPVQLIWSRWQEHLAGRPRTPVAAVIAAKASASGALIGWKARHALPATAREFGQRLFHGQDQSAAIDASAGQADALALEGAVPPYEVEHLAVDHVPVTIDLPTARLRGNAHGYTAFFNECFVDELAHTFKREPLSYRMAMLAHDLRLAQCLQRVAVLAGWGGGSDSSGQGLACHRIGHGRIAAIATARRDESGVRVERIAAVADIGRIINADIARQQIEGGLVYGIGLALGLSTRYTEGLPSLGRLGGLDMPRLADCPEITVEFVENREEPADPGELGVAVAAPAIANALFSATGLRFRRLPLLSEEL